MKNKKKKKKTFFLECHQLQNFHSALRVNYGILSLYLMIQKCLQVWWSSRYICVTAGLRSGSEEPE